MRRDNETDPTGSSAPFIQTDGYWDRNSNAAPPAEVPNASNLARGKTWSVSVGSDIDQIMSDVAATEADANAFDKTVLEGGVMSAPSANLSNLGSSQVQVPADLDHSSVLPATSGGNYYKAPMPTSAGFDLSSIKPVWSSIGGVRTVNLGAGLDLDFENNDYTFRQTRDDDGNIVSTVVEAPENARELGMSLIKKYDPETGNATYSKPEIPEASVTQSLYKSPQFMAPVTASVVNGLFQMLISERMANAQRDEQRRMLDAQFQVLEKKEEANTERRRRVASIYASLREKRRRGEG